MIKAGEEYKTATPLCTLSLKFDEDCAVTVHSYKSRKKA